jgi:hypothetical protein
VAVRRAVACCDRGAHIDRRAQDFVASFGFFFQAMLARSAPLAVAAIVVASG